MMLLPFVETALNPELTTPAAAVSVAAAPELGSNRLGPIAWATCTARSQLVRIAISAPITLSTSLLDVPEGFAPSIGSTALLSRTYRTRTLAWDSYTGGQ